MVDIKDKKIIFDYNFNSKIDNFIKLIINYEELEFGDNLRKSYFDGELNLANTKLKKINLSDEFNKPLDNLPITLEELYIKYKFNLLLDNLPANLKVLSFTEFSNFNFPLDNLPTSLKILVIGKKFNHPLDKLPESLIRLNH